eukprot:TRINITY_DN33_c0_g3_i1.p1 TRINITY_DN33_c0_g3~~TRINITY_DN33_c0_g3_i1.p1  ORF type:complete len:135 (+),score=13.50 TRINITY_DN33_c0_g3_i1:74-478(+)
MKVVVLFAIVACLVALVSANTCGGNCPSNDCPSCPCGTAAAHINIADICSKGPWNQACCRCIVSHESGGNAHAANYNTNGSFDVGVFQINRVNWACNGGNAPCDVASNLKCAIDVWNQHRSFSPWSTCRGCGCC